VALAPLTRPIPLPLPLPLAAESLIANGRARPDACSSAALATISALSASLAARVRLRAGSSTTISFPFLLSRPISTINRKRCGDGFARVAQDDDAEVRGQCTVRKRRNAVQVMRGAAVVVEW
jgi:hypothetical protein